MIPCDYLHILNHLDHQHLVLLLYSSSWFVETHDTEDRYIQTPISYFKHLIYSLNCNRSSYSLSSPNDFIAPL